MIQGKLAELYVDLVAKDSVAPAISEMKGRIANLQADLAKAGTTGWNAQVKQFMDLQKQQADEQKKLARAFDVASLGTFGAKMKEISETLAKWQEGLSGAGAAFGYLSATATGMVAAASPDAFKTFTMSLQYLAAVVGQALLPAFVDVIRWIQQAARWFQNLDDGTKRMIGTFASWAIGLSAAGYAMSRLIGIARMLLGVLQAIAGVRLGALLGGGLLAGGIAAAIGESGVAGDGSRAVGAGVGLGIAGYTMGAAAIPAFAPLAVAYAGSGRGGWFEGFSRWASRAGTDGLSLDPDNPGYVIERSTDYRRVLGMTFASGFSSSTRRGTPEELRALGYSGPAPGAYVEPETRRRAREIVERALPGPEYADMRRRLLGGSPLDRPAGAGADSSPPSGPGVLMATNFQSQFMGVEAMWRGLQQTAASDSPLEAEMRRIATESRDYLFSIAGSTATLAGREPPRALSS